MVEEKRSVMKYIRTYETKEKFLTDKDSTSRGFRLKPTLYKYSEAGDHVHLENDDPRKHGDSTWIRLEFTEATEFSFKISNVTGDDSNTLNYTIDWGDGTIETNTAVQGDDGLYTFTHNYTVGTYDMELYGTDRSYMILGREPAYENDGIGSYFIPPTVYDYHCVNRVIIGDDVEIGDYAFHGCTSITSINLPSTLTSIGGAFGKCTSLTSINLPSTLTSISKDMFNGCFKLTSINIPESVTSIGTSAFTTCSSFTSINIPEGVTSIGENAFGYCSKLNSINIPEGVTSIGGRAFQSCGSLSSISLPSTLTSIDEGMFSSCGSLSSINIPEGVTSIRGSVFWECALNSIKLPSALTSIGENAFGKCTSLTSISSYNTTAPTLGSSVFTSMPKNGTLHIKPGATGYDAWKSQLPSGWTIVEDL